MNPIGQFYGLCQEKLLLQFWVLKEEEQQQQLLLLLWNFTTKSSSVWIFCCFWVVTINSFCWLFVDFWKIVRASSVFYCQGAWKTVTTSGRSFQQQLWCQGALRTQNQNHTGCLQDGSSHRSTNACDEFRQKISSLWSKAIITNPDFFIFKFHKYSLLAFTWSCKSTDSDSISREKKKLSSCQNAVGDSPPSNQQVSPK